MKNTSRPHLSKFLKYVRQPLFVLDDEAVIIFCNTALEKWTGCTPAQLLGRQLRYRGAASCLKLEITAAALAPPPEVLQENRRCRILLTLDQITAHTRRYADYIPLAPSGVLVLIDGNEAPPNAPLTESAFSAQQAASLELHQAVQSFRQRQAGRFRWEKMIGASQTMQRVRRLARLAVEQNVSVLITGEKGTGKEHLASAIHHGKEEMAGALIPAECKILDHELMSTVIYSFQKRYRQEETNRQHTLFLKDAECFPTALVPMIADFIALNSPNLRLISTSAVEPEQWNNHPSLPLLLGTLRIGLPPLRSRKEDIAVLAQMFLEKHNGNIKQQRGGFTSDAVDLLTQYDWKGNLDELEESVAAAYAAGKSTKSSARPAVLIRAEDLPERIHYVVNAR